MDSQPFAVLHRGSVFQRVDRALCASIVDACLFLDESELVHSLNLICLPSRPVHRFPQDPNGYFICSQRPPQNSFKHCAEVSGSKFTHFPRVAEVREHLEFAAVVRED